MNLIMLCLWKGTYSIDTTSESLPWLYCPDFSFPYRLTSYSTHDEKINSKVLNMPPATITHSPESTRQSLLNNWIVIKCDQKNNPDGYKKNVKYEHTNAICMGHVCGNITRTEPPVRWVVLGGHRDLQECMWD